MVYGFDEKKQKVDVIKTIDVENIQCADLNMVTTAIDYPESFNYGNTIVLAIASNYNDGVDWCWGDDKINVSKLSVRNGTDKIRIDLTPSVTGSFDLKLILAKDS